MKKLAITIAAVAGASLTAFSQGQVNFENANANGYVIESSASHTATSAGSYVQSASFTAQLWALSGPSTTVPAAVDSYGYLAPSSLASSGFSLVSGTTTAGSAGAFNAGTVVVPGTTSANTILAVVCWSGTWANLATALANQAYVGVLAFQQTIGPAQPSPIDPAVADVAIGWNTLANSPLSAANSGNEDLIMTQATVVPEPGTMALAALGGASLLLFRRRK